MTAPTVDTPQATAPTAAEREGEDGAIDWLRTVVSFGEKRGDLTLTLGTHLLRNALAAHDAALLAARREVEAREAALREIRDYNGPSANMSRVLKAIASRALAATPEEK